MKNNLNGKKTGFKITYDRETLELKEVLRLEKALVLQKKQEE
jgi:hypothetical protein